MIYKSFQNLHLSALGLGCMRLPVVDGDNARIDQAAVEEMIACAMSQGINYYDTAWGYHGGTSESVIGKMLSAYPRESFYIADKFPGYDLSNIGKVQEIFPAQLERCQVDYFDFYLLHNVCEMNIEAYFDPQYGIIDYLLEQKAAGRIRHLGFSCHGALPVLQQFLERYASVMEFCQLQLNYIDWEFQDCKSKVALLAQHNIPVWVMEPLRGGRLANVDAQAASAMRTLRPEESVPSMAFRFLQTIPEVTVVLSGMSNLSQLQSNLNTFQTEAPLSQSEWDILLELGRSMTSTAALPCTGCRYCVTHCPQELDIPRLLSLYNEYRFTGGGPLVPRALSVIADDKKPSACLGCRSCEAVCPQQLKISEAMADFCVRLP